MKTLYLVRHAKSSWEIPELADFERPLNDRGKRDAPKMGKRLKEREVVADLMITSPAKRAHETARQIARILNYDEDKIKTDMNLYHAGEEEILTVIRDTDDRCATLLVFGHNPGLTEFANSLSDKDNLIRNIPTGGVVCFTFAGDRWKNVAPGKGEFVFFDFPKNKKD